MTETMPLASALDDEPEYALGRTQQEYQRLRTHARFWEQATDRLLRPDRHSPRRNLLSPHD